MVNSAFKVNKDPSFHLNNYSLVSLLDLFHIIENPDKKVVTLLRSDLEKALLRAEKMKEELIYIEVMKQEIDSAIDILKSLIEESNNNEEVTLICM